MDNDFDSNNALLPPVKFWSFNFGTVTTGATVYTDVVDLGENSLYTLLVARKIGNTGYGDYLAIESSVDGARWVFAPGEGNIWNNDHFIAMTTWPGSPAVYCTWGRPVGRYIRVKFENGSVVQNSLIVDLAAFAGIELGINYNW